MGDVKRTVPSLRSRFVTRSILGGLFATLAFFIVYAFVRP